MSVSLLPYIQTSLVNHQGFTITFSKYKGKVVCHYSQGDIPLGTNIPFFITEDPPPLSAYTITYYPSHKVFVWDHYGLRGGMEGGGDISSKKESS
ncbi:MAG: hypothetical protein KDK76_06405, partial [Chlamydiia bacterium]|nr:hypothetical protein [Chlamydiia bacterium]